MPYVIFRHFEPDHEGILDNKIAVRDTHEAEVAMQAASMVLNEPLENYCEIFFADYTGKATHQWDPDSLRWMTPEEKEMKEKEDA